MRARIVAMVIFVSASAGAVDFAGRARGAVSAGIDSNPRRDFVSPDAGGTPVDAALQGVVNLVGSLQGDRGLVSASYDVGVRKFVLLPTEDTIVQAAQLDASLWLGGGFGVGFTGRARDRRGAARDYTDLSAEANLSFVPDDHLDFRVWAAAHRFIFWRGFEESYAAPEGGLLVRYRINKRHSAFASGLYSYRTFNAMAYYDPTLEHPPAPAVRRDPFVLVSATYWYRGPVIFSLSYGYLDSSSNSWGHSLAQHRVNLVFGAPLFWQLKLMIDINLRFSMYRDGLFIDPMILTLDESSENLSSGVIKLARPIGEHFEVEARYGFYYGQLPNNGFIYLRHAGSLGVGVHF